MYNSSRKFENTWNSDQRCCIDKNDRQLGVENVFFRQIAKYLQFAVLIEWVDFVSLVLNMKAQVLKIEIQTEVEWAEAVESSDSSKFGAVGYKRSVSFGVEVSAMSEGSLLVKSSSSSESSSSLFTPACSSTWLGSVSQIRSSYGSVLSFSESWEMNSLNKMESKFLESRNKTNQSPMLAFFMRMSILSL